jgi:uncharacterized protein involved in outer membrane biogenesis
VRRKLLIATVIALTISVVVIAAAILYLKLGDLSRHRGTVERLVSDALGRELRIDGDFAPDIGLTSHLEASQITLANPDWSSEPYMVSVDRLAGEIELLPLLRGSYRIDNLEVEGARVLLESDESGRTNWQFDTGKPADTEGGGPLDLVIGQARLQDGELIVKVPSLGRPLELTVTSLGFETDDTEILDLSIRGALNEAGLGLSGRLGTLAELLAAGEIEHDLEGNLGDVGFTSRGIIGDLATFADADLEISIDGPSMSEVTDLLGLESLGEGPFQVAASAEPAGDEFAVTLDGTFGQVSIGASGRTDALFDPGILDLGVQATGPDFAAVVALAGIEDAARRPFAVSGHVRWEGFPVTLDEVAVTIGDNRIALDGTIGAPPTLMGTDFRFDADGPDVSAVSVLAGFGLPAERFQIHGRLVRLEDGIGIQGVEAMVGPAVAKVDGILGDPPGYAGTDLQVAAQGPNLVSFSELAGVTLPALPFEIAGRLAPEGDSITLENVTARLGPNSARVEGTVGAVTGFIGTDVLLSVEGPDLSWLEGPTGFTDLPRRPYRVEGGLVVEQTGYRLDGVNARVGDVTARVDGLVGRLPGLAGTSLQFVTEGPDFSIPTSLVGAPGVPPEPFRIEGGLRMVNGSFELEAVQARVGDARATVAGWIAPSSDLVGTELTIDAEGPDASTFGPLLRQPSLPSAPFALSGSVEIGTADYRLGSVVVELAGNRAAIDGTVVPSETLSGTDLQLEFTAPDLGDLGYLVSQTGLVELPELPREPFSIAGGVTIDDDGYLLKSVEGTLGTATARVDGRLGFSPGFVGTDLAVHGDGPNASLFTAVTGVSVPVAPFRVNGRVERLAEGVRFHDLRVQLGEYRAQAHGRLGELPKLIGTDFDIRVEGPSLVLVTQLTGVAGLPDLPFVFAGSFEGDPRRFKTEEFSARLGPSDVGGSFRVDLEGKPRIQAQLASDVLNVRRHFEQRAAKKAEQKEAAGESATSPRPRGAFVISDTPFELGILNKLDADVNWRVGEFVLPLERFSDIEIDVQLADGRLQAGPLAITGSGGGTLDADLRLEPAGNAYTFKTNLIVDDVRMVVSRDDELRDQRPTIDMNVEYGGTGSSPHEIASTANGRIHVVASEGVMDSSIMNLVAADVLIALLEALNPFSKEKPATRLDCAVIVFNIENGVAVLNPMAVQTDVMTVLGGGKIDFSTEDLDLSWVTKPRKGIGVSASLITNPYIKLGGTLGRPQIEMKPLEAMTSTGIAVATGGISILAKGLFDRITAEQNVCEQALKKVEKRQRKRAGTGG